MTTLVTPAGLRRSPAEWWRTTNRHPGVVAFVRRARRLLPGDPEFGDPLSTAGDGAALTLLRRVARAVEPPLLDAGGHIVKRLGDGIMAVFRDPAVAVGAVLIAKEALKSVEVSGYTPRMRVGIHTGRPQRLAADRLGVDVNIAARVMERATKGGVMVSGTTLDLIAQSELDSLGVVARRSRRPMFSSKITGIPPDLAIYRLKALRELTASDDTGEIN